MRAGGANFGSFSTIFRNLVRVTQTSPIGSRIYFKGFSDPINSFKPFPDHFEQLLKKSIFWVSDVFGPGLIPTMFWLFFQMLSLDI